MSQFSFNTGHNGGLSSHSLSHSSGFSHSPLNQSNQQLRALVNQKDQENQELRSYVSEQNRRINALESAVRELQAMQKQVGFGTPNPSLPPSVPHTQQMHTHSGVQASSHTGGGTTRRKAITANSNAPANNVTTNIATVTSNPAFRNQRSATGHTYESALPPLTQSKGHSRGDVSLTVRKEKTDDDMQSETESAGGEGRTHECPYNCGYKTTRKGHITRHIMTHTGEKPYVCTYPNCTASFSANHALTSHLRSHTGERPYPCTHPGCDTGFGSYGALKVHLKRHSGPTPFPCTVARCSRSFVTEEELAEHLQTHTTEKPYECTHPGCGHRFSSRNVLSVHVRIHSGEKPYACIEPGCNARYASRSNLWSHAHTTGHAYEKPAKGKKPQDRMS